MPHRSLLSADPPDPGGSPPPGDPPASPKVVKKTALTTPREIDLQKKVSKLEDRVGTLEGTIDSVNAFLSDAFPNPPKPGKPTPATPPAPAKSILDEISDALDGNF